MGLASGAESLPVTIMLPAGAVCFGFGEAETGGVGWAALRGDGGAGCLGLGGGDGGGNDIFNLTSGNVGQFRSRSK